MIPKNRRFLDKTGGLESLRNHFNVFEYKIIPTVFNDTCLHLRRRYLNSPVGKYRVTGCLCVYMYMCVS